MWFFEQTRCLAQVPLMQQKRFPSWWKLKINLESSGWYHLMGFSNTFPNSGKWSIPILRSSPWLDPICPFVMMCHDVSRFQLPLMLSGSTPGFICGSGAPTRGRKGEMVRMKHMRFESCLETPNPCMTAPSVRIVLQVFATATSCGTAIRDGRNNSKISWNKSVAGPTLPGCWAYDSRWPKIIKHAGKAFPPWAKHPRIQESLRFNKFQQESLGSLSDGHVERTLLCMMRKDLHLVSSRTVRMTRDWTCGQSTQTAWHRFKTDLIHVLLYGVVSGNHAVAGMWPYVWEFCDICITAICKLFQDVGAPNGFSCCSKMVKRPHWEHGYAGRQHSKTVCDLLREGNDKQSGHNSTHLHRKRNTLPSLWGSSSFDRGPSSPSYISAFPVFHWTCLASQLWELFSSLSLRKMSKHWPEHTHGLLNVSEPMAFVRYGPVKKSNT